MKCQLIQQLLDAKKILNHFKNLNQTVVIKNHHRYSVRDWFINHQQVLAYLHPKKITYPELSKQINKAMADLF